MTVAAHALEGVGGVDGVGEPLVVPLMRPLLGILTLTNRIVFEAPIKQERLQLYQD